MVKWLPIFLEPTQKIFRNCFYVFLVQQSEINLLSLAVLSKFLLKSVTLKKILLLPNKFIRIKIICFGFKKISTHSILPAQVFKTQKKLSIAELGAIPKVDDTFLTPPPPLHPCKILVSKFTVYLRHVVGFERWNELERKCLLKPILALKYSNISFYFQKLQILKRQKKVHVPRWFWRPLPPFPECHVIFEWPLTQKRSRIRCLWLTMLKCKSR